MRTRLFALFATLASTLVATQPVGAIPYAIDAAGNVVWGIDKSDRNPITDYRIPRQQTGPGHLDFYWTTGSRVVPHPDKPPEAGSFLVTYEPHPSFDRVLENNTAATGRQLKIFRPSDQNEAIKISGWAAQTTDGEGFSSKVFVGNVKRSSPWEFTPYSQLSDRSWKIPVLGQADGSAGPLIYTAVNLALYLQANPLGPQQGLYTLDELLSGIGSISNGELYAAGGSKMAGIYFATSEWALDPDPESTSGFYPTGGRATLLDGSSYQQEHGAIAVMTIFQVHEPSALVLLCASLGIFGFANSLARAVRLLRRRMPSGWRTSATPL